MLTAKFALTSDCNLRCSYCLIDKDRNEHLDPRSIGAALREVVDSPGRIKSVGIYGGEPLLYPDVVRSLVRRARRLEKRHRKIVNISLATNGLPLTVGLLRFMRDNDVMVCVSIDGRTHDRERRFADGRGSLAPLLRALELAFSTLARDRVMALQGVHPGNVDFLEDDFRCLGSLGFRAYNFEVIQGPAWSPAHELRFAAGLEAVRRTILAGIPRDERMFLQSVNRELYRLRSGCPEQPAREIDPSGRVGYTPYPFLHASEGRGAERVLAGLEPGRRVLELRRTFSRRFARDILRRACEAPKTSGYARQAALLGTF